MSLRLLLEGESLLNDASSITLFTIFLSEVMDYRKGIQANAGVVVGNIIKNMVVLAVGAASDGSLIFVAVIDVMCSAPCLAGRVHVLVTHMLHCRVQHSRQPIQHNPFYTGSICTSDVAIFPPCGAIRNCHRDFFSESLEGALGREQQVAMILAVGYVSWCIQRCEFPCRRRSNRARVWHSNAVHPTLDAAWGRRHRAAGGPDICSWLPLILHSKRPRQFLRCAPEPRSVWDACHARLQAE